MTRIHGPGRPLVFNHIPKTAGTSLRTSLRAALQPTLVEDGFDLALVGGYDEFDDVSETALDQVYFSPGGLDIDADLVIGHISPGTTMERYPDGDHVTLLRDPRLRLVSQWVHSRSLGEFDLRHFGRAGRAFRIARTPLRDYLNHAMVAPNVDNTITRFLTWPHPLLKPDTFIEPEQDEELLAAALDRLRRFDFVTVVEDVDAIARLGDWLGRDLPRVRVNERSSVPRRRRTDIEAELDPATRELLEHRTRIDYKVWTHVAQGVLKDPEGALAAGWDKAMARYVQAFSTPVTGRPVRRTVAAIYGAAWWLRHGRGY